MKLDYPPEFYTRLRDGVSSSAKAVVPIVFELLRPTSVVDVGCGTGIWLAEFRRHGVADILGIDGPHITVDQLQIAANEFLAADLALPLRLRGYFDLAMSLEVAEHLEADRADPIIESLTRLAPAVLFSAAIPFQGGEHHVNEQWPAYWIERFQARDFIAIDPFRRLLWERPDVDWWYAQNLFLFVRHDHAPRFPKLVELESNPIGIPTFIHPRNYLRHTWQNRVLHVAVDLAAETRPAAEIIVIDGDQFGPLYLPGRRTHPFVEKEGCYFGPPRDDDHAIVELERMRAEGCDYLAVGWTAFWWLDHYRRFRSHLEENYPVVLRNDRVVLFRLRPS